MATVIPIYGLRYNETRAGAIENLVTPPYDVIDAAAQDAFYNRSPYNIIRLEYGKTYPTDEKNTNRYTRAAEIFRQWQAEGIMQPEPKPALYLYRQEFSLGSQTLVRSGMICGVKLEPYEKGVVLPHEETMPKHKADRLALMQACGANFSPVFGLYSDQERNVDAVLDQAVQGQPPAVDFTDDDNHRHLLWVIDNPGVIRQVQQLMADERILIADGHHRYETALNFARENPGQPGTGYVMMTLINLFDPGVVVLPTHRLITAVAIDGPKLLELLQEDFEVTPAGETDPENIDQRLAALAALDEQSGTKMRQVFGLYLGPNQLYTLALKNNDALAQKMQSQHSQAWCNLDVSVLQNLILDKLLGIDSKALAGGEAVKYTRDTREAIRGVDQGQYQMAFLMNPTLIAEITEVAGLGEKMPQKSTFFYPKLITGLVVNKL